MIQMGSEYESDRGLGRYVSRGSTPTRLQRLATPVFGTDPARVGR